MEKHICKLNKAASLKCKYVIKKKRKSGKILLYLLYNKIGINLPHDMCYEIESYLVYDTRTIIYKKVVFQRYQYLYLYKEILHDSLQILSRFREKNTESNNWYVIHQKSLHQPAFSNRWVFDCAMYAIHCIICGNYKRSQGHYPLNRIIVCFC